MGGCLGRLHCHRLAAQLGRAQDRTLGPARPASSPESLMNPAPDAKNNTLTACNLTKRYAQRCVLKGISFTLGQGEVLGILGPSGGGKTTLLRCLTLLDLPEDGSVGYP